MKAIADMGFLVAFGNRKDYHHEWALGIAEGVTEPLLTCEAVLAETAGAVDICVERAYYAIGGVGGALRGSQAGSGGSLPHSS